MATLHPFVAHYKENGLIKHSNLVVISECYIVVHIKYMPDDFSIRIVRIF